MIRDKLIWHPFLSAVKGGADLSRNYLNCCSWIFHFNFFVPVSVFENGPSAASFRPFFSSFLTNNFATNICEKYVLPVYGAGSRTHDLLNMSLAPFLYRFIISFFRRSGGRYRSCLKGCFLPRISVQLRLQGQQQLRSKKVLERSENEWNCTIRFHVSITVRPILYNDRPAHK